MIGGNGEIETNLKVELRDIAKFISQLNVYKNHHIGYIGDQESEILQALQDEFDEEGMWHQFFKVVYEDKKIVAVLGLNIDQEASIAEIWGPYILSTDQNYLSTAIDLWSRVLAQVGNNIKEFHGFYNKENIRGNQFMEYLKADRISDQTIMKVKKLEYQGKQDKSKYKVEKISSKWHKHFVRMHDSIFPDTYYAGEKILQLINRDKLLYVAILEDELVGYCYSEAEPEFNEGSIEYIAVSDKYRGRGVGKALLYNGLNELFLQHSINEVSVCVDYSNKNAIHLYESIGFKIDNILQYYKLISTE